MECTFQNRDNYGIYNELIDYGKLSINTSSISDISIWDQYFKTLLNVLTDGIESDIIKYGRIYVTFADGCTAPLSVPDYFFNLIMWYLNIAIGNPITHDLLFFEENMTGDAIEKYINNKFINPNRKTYNNILLNNIIDDCLFNFKYVDSFSFYLSNTICLEDFIDLMNKESEFYDCLHVDLSTYPIEDVKNIGMDYTNKAINYIKNSDHCLCDSLRSKEGVNVKQFREFCINIGAKPDGQGSVYPAIINSNFMMNGVNDLTSSYIESSVGRTAQILQKINVSKSGDFARLLGLNNMDTTLHKNPNYCCESTNFQILTIESERMLRMLDNRYYRLSPTSMEYHLKSTDTHLIGKTIYLRSPMTCASAARGEGICYKCYGDLAYTNHDINIGKIAAEILSSQLTQRMLSAKHLLESSVKQLKWSPEFDDIFEIEFNSIKVQDSNFKGYNLIIDPDDICQEDEFDDYDFNEYITDIKIQYPDGRIVSICTEHNDNIYITGYLNTLINNTKPVNKLIYINLNNVNDSLFNVILYNNELSQALNNITKTIDNSSVTKSYDRHGLLQALLNHIIRGGLTINAVHAEVILSNQIRNNKDILMMPDWENPNESYQILTLNNALIDNPHITISLSYQKVSKALYYPTSYRKNKASSMDLFFMTQPQNYLNNLSEVSESVIKSDKE